jgi:hypothetical protein
MPAATITLQPSTTIVLQLMQDPAKERAFHRAVICATCHEALTSRIRIYLVDAQLARSKLLQALPARNERNTGHGS